MHQWQKEKSRPFAVPEKMKAAAHWHTPVGEALSLPKLTQPNGSVNVERLRAAPTRHSQFLSGLHIGTRHVGEALSLPK